LTVCLVQSGHADRPAEYQPFTTVGDLVHYLLGIVIKYTERREITMPAMRDGKSAII